MDPPLWSIVKLFNSSLLRFHFFIIIYRINDISLFRRFPAKLRWFICHFFEMQQITSDWYEAIPEPYNFVLSYIPSGSCIQSCRYPSIHFKIHLDKISLKMIDLWMLLVIFSWCNTLYIENISCKTVSCKYCHLVHHLFCTTSNFVLETPVTKSLNPHHSAWSTKIWIQPVELNRIRCWDHSYNSTQLIPTGIGVIWQFWTFCCWSSWVGETITLPAPIETIDLLVMTIAVLLHPWLKYFILPIFFILLSMTLGWS